MPKTTFVDGDKFLGIPGTRVLAAFLNKVFSHRHDGLDQDGSAPTDYVPAASGDGISYTATFTPALTQHIVGLPLIVMFPSANTSTTPTFDPNSLGAKQIQRKNGVTLNIGDIQANFIGIIVYNGSSYDLLNPYLLLDQSVTAAKATALLGAWDLSSYSVATNYQAATDITVHAWANVNTAAMTITGYSDATATPTQVIAQSQIDGITGWNSVAITFNVKKGHYWRVENATGTPHISVTPLGS